MAISQLGLGTLSMVFLSASLVMLWFIILSGVTSTTPLDKTFFLRADTRGITGARPITQWTYFFICGDGNTNCDPAIPALPIGYAWAGGARNVPAELIGSYGGDTTSHQYWYLWRFGTVFYLITLFFSVIAFFTGFLSCCSRLGSALSGLISLVALFFNTLAVSLMTATFVKMRNAFAADNREASLGTYAFGFAWGSWAALLISTVLFCIGRRKEKNVGPTTGRRGWGRRSKSVRSGKSYDGRRVKEEYP
ncbi:protein SUR7 [Echria macrotheca]|uniref:Protein SUR7 n=1 Tax=Echria macrotheca TaxID=438768 RepID=A0AAJ0BI82_9PEZI|nr:protein SUR7 [Echria macrotheca]